MRTPGLLNQPAWAKVIPVELSGLNGRKPPTQYAGQAHRLALSWLGAPLVELPAEEEQVFALRDRIAAGAGHPDEHLGEAQSIVIAKRLGAVFVSDDGGARAEASVEKVRAVSVCGLLGLHQANNKITAAVATAALGELISSGRVARGVSLDVPWLVKAGHIRL